MKRPSVIIAGGSGYLGKNLAHHLLERDYEVTILSRSPVQLPDAIKQVRWDGRTTGSWASTLEGAAALVNLAGRTVDCIKTPQTMDEILRSRVESTLALGQALKTVRRKPKTWVQMSTAHIYGDSLEKCEEDSAFGYGLAPDVGRAWETAFQASLPRTMRGVILRTSFVIGKNGGALRRLALLVRIGLGGTVGHGYQGMSWIHEEDMNHLFRRAIENRNMKGAYIASAPHPESQREFMKKLRKAMGMPIGLPASAWMVKLGAPLLMNTDPDLALYGRFCRSARLSGEGFDFQFPTLELALKDIMY
ncbi:MAG: TIGR01777 family oxidoreductase [Leptospiraceae bacterium]|nr:TIGR01777 family oxidoreductase [Leptospiraceae bacterium]